MSPILGLFSLILSHNNNNHFTPLQRVSFSNKEPFPPCLLHHTKDAVFTTANRQRVIIQMQAGYHMTIIWLHPHPRPLCCCAAAYHITAAHFNYEYDYLKHFISNIGFTLQPDLRGQFSLTAWPEVSFLCCWSARLWDQQAESIVLREFKVSDYMASALGRLEKYRGNATLHVFYTVLITESRALTLCITKQG